MLFDEFDSNHIFQEKELVQILPQAILHYVARVRFGIRVRVRVRVRDSAIFEKGRCGCGGTRRLKNY